MKLPELNHGETYIGAIGNKAGEVYHLILIGVNNERAPWQKQLEWAASVGGDLPNKIESAMLFANAKDQFKPEWYWTNETLVDPDDPEDTSYAWCQLFFNGYQSDYLRCISYRACAVRMEIVK